MTDYIGIYEALDSTLRKRCDTPSEFNRLVDSFVRENDGRIVITDDDYHWVLVKTAFYSGIDADRVTGRRPAIEKYLRGYQKVAEYGETMVRKMMADEDMFRKEEKILASINNAKAVEVVVKQHGSFRSYIDSFGDMSDLSNIAHLRNNLRKRFKWIGPVTSFHFMMDVGVPVLKPDLVIMREFERLGLIQLTSDSEANLWEAVKQGQIISQATGKPIRQIDVMFVSLGQRGGKNSELKISRGVCLKEPECTACGLAGYCRYFKNHG